MAKARKCGVPVPYILKCSVPERKIYMEFIHNGRTLKQFLRDPNVASGKKIDKIRQVGSLIATLHDNTIIHGDLTTSNLLITQDEQETIVSFFEKSQISSILEGFFWEIYLVL